MSEENNTDAQELERLRTKNAELLTELKKVKADRDAPSQLPAKRLKWPFPVCALPPRLATRWPAGQLSAYRRRWRSPGG